MAVSADARPTKGFFIENITRDLSLEDAILDLVDNAADSFIRTRNIDVSPALLEVEVSRRPSMGSASKALIAITLNKDEFTIYDRCGGIDLEHAARQVFRFGRPPGSYPGSLGVYGIGMKRAIFKIGKHIVIESYTKKSGLRVEIDVPKWAEDDENWEFPITKIGPARNDSEAGTRITIRGLNDEVKLRVDDGILMGRLREALSTTYSLFLQNFLSVSLNGTDIPPRTLPIAAFDDLEPNVRILDHHMPCETGWRPAEFEFSDEDIDNYIIIHKYYPSYAELLF